MKVGSGAKRKPALPRLLVLVNGRYAAAQCTTLQEPLVNFGIVPKAGVHCCEVFCSFYPVSHHAGACPL